MLRLLHSYRLTCTAVLMCSALCVQAADSLLDTVKARGILHCGTDNTAPGFGYLNTQSGQLEGMDVDFCRAVAAAVLGDANKVKFVTVTDKSRFNAVQTGQVDVVFAHTTFKAVRESAIAVDFLPLYFYDGTGVMVKGQQIKTVSQLNGATLCTTQGSATEQTLATYIKAQDFSAQTKVLTYENQEKLFAAIEAGRCHGMSTDRSGLAAWKNNAPNPADYFILPEVLDKQPFGGFTVVNDSRWRNALRWIIYATFQAEESAINQKNLAQELTSNDPFIQKFLGINASLGPDFGLPEDFVAQIIKQVGNYADIYQRNLGPDKTWAIERKNTANAPWTEGGLLYSPPWI